MSDKVQKPMGGTFVIALGAFLFGIGLSVVAVSTPLPADESEMRPIISSDTTMYMDVIILARTQVEGTVGELRRAISTIEGSVEVHSFEFLSFAPDNGDYLVILPCPDSEGNLRYCTR